MWRVMICSFSSAIAGGLLVLGVTQQPARRNPPPAAPAAEQAPLRGQIRPAQLRLRREAPPAIQAAPPAAAEPARYTSEEQVSIAVYERNHRGVVNISTRSVRVGSAFFWEVEVPSEGAGSGFVIDRQGHIVTNFHVVEDAREVVVTIDGAPYEAEVIGADPPNDLAVLRIAAPPETLHPISLGDSTGLRVGQHVYAIGNPFGLERTFTAGVISSLNRTISSRDRVRTKIKSIIQFDAAVNPGNSGGPLLDARGQLIGMSTAIATNTGQSAGVSFAVPASTIARVVPQLIARGRVIRPDHGVARVAETERGLLVVAVEPDGPAAAAGLQGVRIVERTRRQGNYLYTYRQPDFSAADVILAVDGAPVATSEEFLDQIDRKRPGDVTRLTILREGQELEIEVRLGAE